jgi:hypothetical protein
MRAILEHGGQDNREAGQYYGELLVGGYCHGSMQNSNLARQKNPAREAR